MAGRITTKTMSTEITRGADERGDDDVADDDETNVAVLGIMGKELKEERFYDGCSGSPITVNHVTWLHPVCSQLLSGLKAINSPAALWEPDVMNEGDGEREREVGRDRKACLEKFVAVKSESYWFPV